MTITKQPVYLPVPIKKDSVLPAGNVLCFSAETGCIAAGKLGLNGRNTVSCNTDTVGCDVNYISHYLSPKLAYVLTAEEIKQLFNRYNEFIAHNDSDKWESWIDKQLK